MSDEDWDLFTWIGAELPPELGTPEKPANRLEAKFWKFHLENLLVYEYFCRYAIQAQKRGFTKISADMLMHRVRWETWFGTTETQMVDGEPLRISNSHVAYYARLWMRDHPEWPGFFQLRTLLAGEVSERLQPA